MPIPEPPHGFALSPGVEVMWNRYRGHPAGRAPLPSMAFFCLTVIEASILRPASAAGRNIRARTARREAAAEYRVGTRSPRNPDDRQSFP